MGLYTKIRETGSEVLIFVVRNVVERMLGFLLIPIYTRTFSTHDYGILALLLTTEAFVSQVLQFGITTSYFRAYFDDEREETRRLATSTATWFLLAANLLFLGLTLPIAPEIGQTLLGEARPDLIRLTLLLTVLDTLNYLPFVMLKARQESKLFVAVSWAATLTQFLTIIALVVGLGMGIEGALIGMVVGTAVKTLIYFSVLRRQIALQFSGAVLRPLLVLGVPIVFNSIATLVLRVSDRYFLKHYFSATEVALYQLADQFAAILPLIVANPFSLVWPAMRFKVMRDEDAAEYYSRVLTYLTFASLYVGLGIAALAPDVIRVVATEDYWGAASVVPLFVIYYVLAATAKGVNVGLMIEKRAHWNAVVVIVTAVINIVLNFLWIPRYGMYGAAWATIVSFAFMTWFRWYMSTRFYPIAYEWGRIAKLAGVAVALYGVTLWIDLANPFLSFLVRGLVAASFPLVIALTGFFEPRERARIFELLSVGWSRIARLRSMAAR